MNEFENHSIEELIRWRDAASARVSVNDMIVNEYFNKVKKICKKSHKDKIWINKINRYINKKCFGYKKQID